MTSLELYRNDIGDEGAAAVAKVLIDSKITELDLGYNEIGSAGAVALADVLPKTSITALFLDGNQLCGVDDLGKGTFTLEGL
eukprot:CAMPEP_0119338248 /NCGR_PEP_ID=MMETSP1333-20130426/95638_1 /TAXON_ID=418940 /ORGANISM="Scyphosphaera apsteinii, Strain RCC1455" /LENGTH=81 /DNA_ID=CAMNT_0007349475 /DNA_START=24 /DNA_END=265 /DNA_ORIENTATION=-